MFRDRFRTTLMVTAVSLSLLALALSAARAEDLLELRSGAKVSGEILSRTDKGVSIRFKANQVTLTRTYPLSSISAITTSGKRELIGESDAQAPASKLGKESRTPKNEATGAGLAASGVSKSRAEVLAQIDQLGRTPPEWYEATRLNYPETLDLSWPRKPPPPWDNQKNVGQFIWDIINPNPNKWREGVRLMHHLLTLHKDSPEIRTKVMIALGRMYFSLLEDHARAAFWWQKAGVEKDPDDGAMLIVHLAECYWRLGNRQMAVDLLNRLPESWESIKLWADLGETAKAIQIAEASLEDGYPDWSFLSAGDAARVGGQLPEAISYYKKVIDVTPSTTVSGAPALQRNQLRARANMEAIELFDLSDVTKVPDGTYQSSSLGYEAQVSVEVVVRGHRLESVRVTQHREKQFYSALSDTPRKLIIKQGVKGVDATSGATITSEAIINATAKALAAATK